MKKTHLDRAYLGDPVRLEERNTMKTETPDNYITAHEIEAEPGSDESEYDSNFPSEEPETVADNATNETGHAYKPIGTGYIAQIFEGQEIPFNLHDPIRELIARAECAKQLAQALKMACRALEDNDIDEAMAGEYEILTDALEAWEKTEDNGI